MLNSNKKIDFCNIPEIITRAAISLLFFDKDKFTFNQNLKGEFPNVNDYLFSIRIQDVKGFKRDVSFKEKNRNRYTEIKIVADYFPVKNKDFNKLQRFEKKNAYVVVLVTNDDLQVFGNDEEPMTFRIDDKIKDNSSGDDYYEMIVEGATTVRPQQSIILDERKKQFFKVLLYATPIE